MQVHDRARSFCFAAPEVEGCEAQAMAVDQEERVEPAGLLASWLVLDFCSGGSLRGERLLGQEPELAEERRGIHDCGMEGLAGPLGEEEGFHVEVDKDEGAEFGEGEGSFGGAGHGECRWCG